VFGAPFAALTRGGVPSPNAAPAPAAPAFDMSLPGISKHLKVLERAGLIARGREAQWRPCRLQATPLKEVADWVAGYRRHWEQRLDRLDDYLQELQTKERKRGRTKK
jgi:DNA-binding transcriptional ArsR family regulator